MSPGTAGGGAAGRVVVVGSLNVDLVTRVARHPAPGETITGTDPRRLAGGKGANQALGAARAGAAVTMVGRVGEDDAGAAYRAALAAHGVDADGVLVTPGTTTGFALVVVAASGENAIVVAPGANALVTADDVGAATERVTGADVLMVQLEVPLAAVLAAVRLAADTGVRVVCNPSPLPDGPLGSALLAACDPLVVNEHEAAQLLGATGQTVQGAAEPGALRRLGARSVVMTLGGEGAVWVGPDRVVRVPAERVSPVDTTGAGDAFTGALAAALARGADPEEALRAAVAAGAQACAWEGAQPWTL